MGVVHIVPTIDLPSRHRHPLWVREGALLRVADGVFMQIYATESPTGMDTRMVFSGASSARSVPASSMAFHDQGYTLRARAVEATPDGRRILCDVCVH